MSAANSVGLIRNAAIAAIVGGTVGGAVGVWSLRHPAVTIATVTTAAPARAVTTATETADRPAMNVTAGSSQPHIPPPTPAPQPTEPATRPAKRSVQAPVAPPQSATTPPSARTADDDVQVLERARALARHADVAALIALREGVAHRAAEQGLADSPAIKSELDELDQCLAEARMRQLTHDAEELRKADSKRPR
jgi:hypothetical protein